MAEVSDQEVEMTKRVFEEVKHRLNEMALTRLNRAIPAQRLAAKAGGERVLRGGERKFAIHPSFYHYWGQRLGYACWEDEQFVREFLRDNPECRVKSTTGTIRSGLGSDARANARFHKNYGVWKMAGKN